MTEDEMVKAIQFSIIAQMRRLRPARWLKNTSLEDLVRSYRVEIFAREVAADLIQSNKVLFRGPPAEDHVAGG